MQAADQRCAVSVGRGERVEQFPGFRGLTEGRTTRAAISSRVTLPSIGVPGTEPFCLLSVTPPRR